LRKSLITLVYEELLNHAATVEVFVKVAGKQHYLWWVIDQDGEVVDVFLQARRNGKAAKRFFKRLWKTYRNDPRKMVTDRLRSYGLAHRERMPESIHDTTQYANNRAELSYQPTRAREQRMQQFKSACQAQRFLGAHAAVFNLFNIGRHLVPADYYRFLRRDVFN
jgi:putative transposase